MRVLDLLLVACVAGCGGTSPQTDSGLTADTGADTLPLVPGFAADPRPAGAALYLSVDDPAAASPTVSVWGIGLGPVFGLAAQLALDSTRFAAEAPQAESWLGPDAAKEARYLAVVGGAGAKLGAVRRGAAAGEREVSAATKLATVRLKVVAPGRSRLELVQVQVRRADGSFLPVKVAGGELTAGGAK